MDKVGEVARPIGPLRMFLYDWLEGWVYGGAGLTTLLVAVTFHHLVTGQPLGGAAADAAGVQSAASDQLTGWLMVLFPIFYSTLYAILLTAARALNSRRLARVAISQ